MEFPGCEFRGFVFLEYAFVFCPIPEAKYSGQHEGGCRSSPNVRRSLDLDLASSVTGTKTVVVKVEMKLSA